MCASARTMHRRRPTIPHTAVDEAALGYQAAIGIARNSPCSAGCLAGLSIRASVPSVPRRPELRWTYSAAFPDLLKWKLDVSIASASTWSRKPCNPLDNPFAYRLSPMS